MPSSNKMSVERAFLALMETQVGKELAFACFYDWNIIDASGRFEHSEEWQSVAQIIRHRSLPGRKALDLGAGNGIASYSLARMGFDVTAIEPDPSNLVGYGALRRMIQAASLTITHLSAYGEDLPLQAQTYGLVYVRQVLHHARDLSKMLSEVRRVLKPGGLLIACREHVVDDQRSLESFLDQHRLHQLTGGENAYMLGDYLEAIRTAGMSIEKVLGPWDSVINHYPISNAQLRAQMTADANKKLGILARPLVGKFEWEKRYRLGKSLHDRTPGRLYTFIAHA